MIRVKKDDLVINVSERSFRIVYKPMGFKKVDQKEIDPADKKEDPEDDPVVLKNQKGEVIEENEEVPSSEEEVKADPEVEAIKIDKDNITVKEIEALLEEYNIKYPATAKRDIKLDLLITGLEIEGLI